MDKLFTESFWLPYEHVGLYLVLLLLLFVIAKYAYQIVSGVSVKAELVEHDNQAFIVAFSGFMVGILLTMGGAISGEASDNVFIDLGVTALYGVVGVVLLLFIRFFFDKVLYPKIPFRKSIVGERNLAVGVIEMSHYVAGGILIENAMKLDLEHYFVPLAFLGASLLCMLFFLFVIELVTSYFIREEVSKGNVGLAISVCGSVIALALISSASFSAGFERWGYDLLFGLIKFTIGGLLMLFMRFIIDKLFLPKVDIAYELVDQKVSNTALGLVDAVSYISAALFFLWLIL